MSNKYYDDNKCDKIDFEIIKSSCNDNACKIKIQKLPGTDDILISQLLKPKTKQERFEFFKSTAKKWRYCDSKINDK